MVQATEKQKVSPPYVAFRTLWNFLDRLGEVGTPPRIDRTVWRDNLSGAYGSQLMAALRFLKLIDDEGNADPDLKRMAEDGAMRKSILSTRLTDVYAPAISGLDLSAATSGQLNERFRENYSVTAATFDKAIAFFLQAAQAADIPLSTYIAKKTRQRSPNKKPKAKPRAASSTAKKPAAPTGAGSTSSDDNDASERIVTLHSGGVMKMILTVNPFKLSKSDREFVFGIIDRIQEYETAPEAAKKD